MDEKRLRLDKGEKTFAHTYDLTFRHNNTQSTQPFCPSLPHLEYEYTIFKKKENNLNLRLGVSVRVTTIRPLFPSS